MKARDLFVRTRLWYKWERIADILVQEEKDWLKKAQDQGTDAAERAHDEGGF